MSLTENQLAHPDQFIHRHIGPNAAETSEMLTLLGHNNLDELIDAAVPKKIKVFAMQLQNSRRDDEP